MKQSVWILPVVIVTAGALTTLLESHQIKKWWKGSQKPVASAKVHGQVMTADAQIKLMIKRHLQDIMDCYNGRIEHGLNKEGDLKIAWEIDDQGGASHFQEMANDLEDSELYDCSAEAISQWNFPMGQPFFVHYTFHLKQKAKPSNPTDRDIASSSELVEDDNANALQIPAPPPEQTHAATNSQ
jgi:hypothetical protein